MQLIRHKLEYQRTISYFYDQLNCSHELSKGLKDLLDLKKGQFFTLLPPDANMSRMYDFFGGCILPQNPTHEYVNENGKKSSYTWIPTLKEEISEYIFERMQKENNLSCLFEDVVHRLGDSHLDFFQQYGFLYLKQLYYFLNRSNATAEIILEAIHQVNSLWHLVFILTEFEEPIPVGKEVSLQEIRAFCKKIELLVIGAYDGEGFVFWEPAKATNS